MQPKKQSELNYINLRENGILLIKIILINRAVADAIVTRTKFLLKQAKLEDFQELSTEVLGSEHCKTKSGKKMFFKCDFFFFLM